MDFHKIGNGYVVLERDGEIALAYLNSGEIIEQKSNTFKTVYAVARHILRYDARQPIAIAHTLFFPEGSKGYN